MQLADVNLNDPSLFERGVPHDMFRLLRREAPVYAHPDPEAGGHYWAITKYDDLKQVSRSPELFSSQRWGTMIRNPSDADLPHIQSIMLNMDPPRHRQFRNLVNKVFTPRMVSNLHGRVQGMVDRILDAVCERGEADFVDEIAAPLPMEVICEMVGVPPEDRRHIYDISNRMIGFEDPDLGGAQEAVMPDYVAASAEMFMYASKLAERCRTHPADDLGTALLNAEVDGERLSELDFNSFFLLLAIAGNETTRTVTTNGMLCLIENPDQRRKLMAHRELLPSALEEMLRYNPPVHHFRRTALADTEIRGVKIREGDKVILWYPAANRDEDVFANPDEFQVDRSPNDHVAFGYGEHFCLGANLARMELRFIFDGILDRLPDLELAAAPRRLRSNFINGVKEMRVKFTPSKPLGARAA